MIPSSFELFLGNLIAHGYRPRVSPLGKGEEWTLECRWLFSTRIE